MKTNLHANRPNLLEPQSGSLYFRRRGHARADERVPVGKPPLLDSWKHIIQTTG
jgi:hypothetical protein